MHYKYKLMYFVAVVAFNTVACSVLGNVSTCVQRSTACPKEVLDFYKSTLTTYQAMCKMTGNVEVYILLPVDYLTAHQRVVNLRTG